MKKLLLLFATIITLCAVGLASPISAVDLDSFHIADYGMQMKLSRDANGRSKLEVVETIKAEFPASPRKHGITWRTTSFFDGHSTNPEIVSVTDERGNDLERSASEVDDNIALRIGDPDRYVEPGSHTYIIRYVQHDVTEYFSDKDIDEFHWDIISTDMQTPIRNFDLQFEVEPALEEALNGEATCYQATYGQDTRCEIKQDGLRFTAGGKNLPAGAGTTIAIGFESGTFNPYEQTLMEKLTKWWIIVQAVTFGIAGLLLVLISLRFYHKTNRSRELKPISPEYIPPRNTSVTTAAAIAKSATGSVMTAQLLDLAVRHYIKLYEVKPKSTFVPAEYEIEVIKAPNDLLPGEQELLSDMFGGHLPQVSSRLSLKSLKNDTNYMRRLQDNDKNTKQRVRTAFRLRSKVPQVSAWFKRAAIIVLVVAVVTLSIPLALLSVVVFIMAHQAYVLTDKGLELRRYLEGLKLYIGVAEVDRLKMLQSPEGASKVSQITGDANLDQKSLVKLYERVLPYAVLFNQEKQWSKNLGQYYAQLGTQPDWYTGQAVFNAMAFNSIISDISHASSHVSTSSSSVSGSSGGGFAGSGGGGSSVGSW